MTRRNMTRRCLVRLLVAWTPAAALGSRQPVSPTDHTVRYRAKATILMLSVPMFSRDNVGGGYLRVAERDEAGARRIDLEFAAGSLPQRAAGLNRFGAFEESVLEMDGSLASATYFGFMSASNETSIDQARSALKSKPGNGLTAICGRISSGRLWNRLLRVSDLPQTPWSEHRALRWADPAAVRGVTRRRARDQRGQRPTSHIPVCLALRHAEPECGRR